MKLKLFSLIVLLSWLSNAQDWKDLARNKNVNFYDVVRAATSTRQAENEPDEDSGLTKFMRWKYNNEYKYYPSGDRSQEDPLLLKHAWENYLRNTPQARNRRLTGNAWEELGPRNIDSITGHYSIGLGRVTDVMAVTVDTLFLSSEAGGLWKSTDGGQTWAPKSDNLIASGAHGIAYSPFNHSKMYMDVHNPENYFSYGIYRSDDGGETWYESNFNPTNVGYGGLGDDFRIFNIQCHPTLNNVIFIGTNRGLYFSTDDLQTWTRVYTIFDDQNYAEIYSIAFHPTDPNTVYITDNVWNADKSKIFISHDLGQTWTTSNQIVDGNGDPNDQMLFVDVSPVCPDCVYLATDKGVWKSTNQGQDFTFLVKPNMSFYTGFAVNKDNPDNMIYGYVDVMNTNDGGATWQQVTHWSLGNTNGGYNGTNFYQELQHATDYVHADLHPAKYQHGNYYIGTDGFMCKSSDGGNNWEIISYGTGIRENYRLGVGQNDKEVVMNGSQDNGGSFHNENGWIEITGGDGMEGIVLPLNEKAFIGSYQLGGIYRTFNSGTSIFGITPPGSTGAYWVAPLAFDPKNQMTIYTFRKGIWKSEDFGDTWTKISADVFGSNSWNNMHVAEIARNNTQIMAVSNYEQIKKSTDGGVTFTDIKNNLPNYSIKDIAFAPHDDNIMFVTYPEVFHPTEKIFMSTDGGASWQNITYNLNNIPVHSVVVDNTPDHHIYAGTELGVFYKDFSSNTWLPLDNNMPKVKISEMEIQEGSNYLYATTWGRGLWRTKIPGRKNYPEIAKVSIDNPPTLSLPKEGMSQFVTAKINYSGTLSSVVVNYSVNNTNLDQSINMSHVSGNIWKSDTALPDGVQGDKIYFNVVATGNNNDATTTYTYMYDLREFAYCDATGDDSSYSLAITETIITDADNQSILNQTSANDLYTYYDNPVTELTAGATYTISLTGDPGWPNDDYTAWIDFNNDAEFTDDEKIIFELNTGADAENTFTVPADATLNTVVRMRIRVSYYEDDPQPCGSAMGEVEDYAVKIVPDTTAPVPDVVNLPDINAECEVTTLTPPTATDNLDGSVTGTTTTTLPINTQGTTVVTWTYTDTAGNTSTQTQNVVIDDTTAPVPDVANLPDINAECEVTTLTPPTATDNCSSNVTVTNDATLPINTQGTTVVTWTYDDGNGNTSTQTQNVIIDDTTAPVPDVANLPDINAECEVTTLTPPTATDNCSSNVTVTNGATLPINTQGTTVVTWTYDDGNGNTSTQTQNVIIDDTTAPIPDVATLPDINAECEVTTLTPPTATDNCSSNVTVTNDATLPISTQGTTTVTWTYDDGNGNTSTQTQNVIINDTTAPVPDVATLPDVMSECEVTSLTAPTATDNCTGSITTTTNVTLPINTQGLTLVTWTYDDGNGNTTTQTQAVYYFPINNSVSQNGNILTATASASGNNYTYQWGDCSNGSFAPINGETGPSLTLTQDGYYAVEISNGTCSVISDCIHVTGVGIAELSEKGIKIYPNPNTGHFYITVNKNEEPVSIRIYDLTGKLLKKMILNKDKNLINIRGYAKGVYILQINSSGQLINSRIIKN